MSSPLFFAVLGIFLCLCGCSSLAIPGYTVSVSAIQVGPAQVGNVSVTVQPHTDYFGPATTPTSTTAK